MCGRVNPHYDNVIGNTLYSDQPLAIRQNAWVNSRERVFVQKLDAVELLQHGSERSLAMFIGFGCSKHDIVIPWHNDEARLLPALAKGFQEAQRNRTFCLASGPSQVTGNDNRIRGALQVANKDSSQFCGLRLAVRDELMS